MFLLRGVVSRRVVAGTQSQWGRPMMCSTSGGGGGEEDSGDKKPGETITDRLRRLSVTRPEEFEPTAVGDTLREAKGRYSRTLKEYENRFAMKQQERYRSQRGHRNYDQQDRFRRSNDWDDEESGDERRGGGGGGMGGSRGDSWRGFGQFREMSTYASSAPSGDGMAEKLMRDVGTVGSSSSVTSQFNFSRNKKSVSGDKKKKTAAAVRNEQVSSVDEDGRQRSRSESVSSSSGPASSEKSVSESEALSRVSLFGDADSFGSLGGGVLWRDVVGAGLEKELQKEDTTNSSSSSGATKTDEIEDDDDFSFYPIGEKWSMAKLSRRIKELADAKKVNEAVLTLEGALNVGGFHFDRADLVYLYNVCISLSGSVGHVDLAFRLFNDMKKRGFPPKASTYTSLFNACAMGVEYKDREEVLERIEGLRGLMGDKGVVPNLLNYHSMMKAYGRCGDLLAAFAVVDEMLAVGEKEVRPNTETFNFLLQACLSDTASGFRHALVTWRKMGSLHIRPDIFSYNLLLRVVRECGVSGNNSNSSNNRRRVHQQPNRSPFVVPPVRTEEEADEVLKLVVSGGQEENSNKALQLMGEGASTSSSVVVPRSGAEFVLALEYPENRLAVLGGLRGLFTQMATDRVGPNMKTLNELALIIHPNEASDLLVLLRTYKLSPSVDMFNVLLKRCHVMGWGVQAKNLLRLLPSFNLTPNIATWGVCALGCRNVDEAATLLHEMDAASFTPNVAVMGGLLGGSWDPEYVLFVMEETRRREVKIDGKFVLQLESYRQKMRRAIVERETSEGGVVASRKMEAVLSSPDFERNWGRFCMKFNSYLKKTRVEEEPKDPWAQQFAQFIQKKKELREKKSWGDNDDMFPLSSSSSSSSSSSPSSY